MKRQYRRPPTGAIGDVHGDGAMLPPLEEPENRTRADGTHRIEFELWAGRPSMPSGLPNLVRYWPETPRENEHIVLHDAYTTFEGNVRAVLWSDAGVPLVRFS